MNDYSTPKVDPPPTLDELMWYAGLLAWVMSEEDRRDVEDTAVHIWRVELTVEEHARLQQFLPLTVEEYARLQQFLPPEMLDTDT